MHHRESVAEAMREVVDLLPLIQGNPSFDEIHLETLAPELRRKALSEVVDEDIVILLEALPLEIRRADNVRLTRAIIFRVQGLGTLSGIPHELLEDANEFRVFRLREIDMGIIVVTPLLDIRLTFIIRPTAGGEPPLRLLIGSIGQPVAKNKSRNNDALDAHHDVILFRQAETLAQAHAVTEHQMHQDNPSPITLLTSNLDKTDVIVHRNVLRHALGVRIDGQVQFVRVINILDLEVVLQFLCCSRNLPIKEDGILDAQATEIFTDNTKIGIDGLIGALGATGALKEDAELLKFIIAQIVDVKTHQIQVRIELAKYMGRLPAAVGTAAVIEHLPVDILVKIGIGVAIFIKQGELRLAALERLNDEELALTMKHLTPLVVNIDTDVAVALTGAFGSKSNHTINYLMTDFSRNNLSPTKRMSLEASKRLLLCFSVMVALVFSPAKINIKTVITSNY